MKQLIACLLLIVGSAHADTEKLDIDNLIFYALDKASHFELSRRSNTDSLAKVELYTFASLIVDQVMFWTIINSTLSANGYPIVTSSDLAEQPFKNRVDTGLEIRALLKSKVAADTN